MLKGIIVGMIIGAGFTVAAASGDLIYESNVSVEITGPQAATLADAFIALSAWDGNRADMLSCTVGRNPGAPGFLASCRGTKSSPAASLPINGGVTVVGVEP